MFKFFPYVFIYISKLLKLLFLLILNLFPFFYKILFFSFCLHRAAIATRDGVPGGLWKKEKSATATTSFEQLVFDSHQPSHSTIFPEYTLAWYIFSLLFIFLRGDSMPDWQEPNIDLADFLFKFTKRRKV